MSILRLLNQTGGRLLGRFDQEVPFVLTDPQQPDAKETVDVAVAEDLHIAGFIEIDEAAPIADIYTFQISAAGKAYVQFSA